MVRNQGPKLKLEAGNADKIGMKNASKNGIDEKYETVILTDEERRKGRDAWYAQCTEEELREAGLLPEQIRDRCARQLKVLEDHGHGDGDAATLVRPIAERARRASR